MEYESKNIKENHVKTIGERSIYTQTLINALLNKDDGETITYNEASELIGMEARPGAPGYRYLRSAMRIVQSENRVQFENVKMIGYRRMFPVEVGESSFDMLRRKMKSVMRLSKKRIDTTADYFDELTPQAKQNITMARTVIAFNEHTMRPKQIKSLQLAVSDKVLGFSETVKLFE